AVEGRRFGRGRGGWQAEGRSDASGPEGLPGPDPPVGADLVPPSVQQRPQPPSDRHPEQLRRARLSWLYTCACNQAGAYLPNGYWRGGNGSRLSPLPAATSPD